MFLLKHIAQTGNYPSRLIEKLLAEKQVTVNGKVANRGTKVKEGDLILIAGEPLKQRSSSIYLAFHKPAGVTTTSEADVKDNIISYINYPERIFPIGRLDKDSEGLILLTNDGDIANRILHSDNDHEKEYLVTVKEKISNRFVLAEMAAGMEILGTVTKPCTIEQVDDHTLRMILTQGLNRQVRRMCHAAGFEVTRLVRVRIMNITLGDLPEGKWRALSEEELKKLFEQLNVENKLKG